MIDQIKTQPSDIVNSFVYYEKNYDFFSRFNSGGSKCIGKIIKIFFKALYIIRVNEMLKPMMIKKTIQKIVCGDIACFTHSTNNTLIYDLLYSEGLCFPIYNFNTQKKPARFKNYFSTFYICCCAITQANLVYEIFKSNSENEIVYKNIFRILKLSGLSFIYDIILRNHRLIIHYNDHTPYSVLLYDMAKKRRVKTVYIQHAPVSNRFPPLYHDLNVLFSEDSRQKYMDPFNRTRTFILFDVRFLLWQPPDIKSDTILICPNKMDNISTIQKLSNELNKTHSIILRPHPADKRNWASKAYTLSKNKTIREDIQSCKYFITNESSVILEAIYANRICYKCSFFSESIDNYSFIRLGLIENEVKDVKTLIKYINTDFISTNKSMLNYFIGDINNTKCKIDMLNCQIKELITME